MSAIQALKDFLGDRPHNYLPSTMQFLELDLGKVAKELRLEEIGAERGKEHKPPATALSFDDVESAVVSRIEGERRACHDNFQSEIATFHQRLAALNIQRHFTSVQADTRRAISEFKAEVGKGGNELTHTRDLVVANKENMADFKSKNNLKRPAYLPLSHIWHWAVVATLFLIEAVLNSTFLAVGNELGLIGGLAQSIIIAAINVGLSLIIGRMLLPQINHTIVLRKLTASAALLIYSFLIFGLNIGVAHFRDASNSSAADIGRTALDTLRTAPFEISSLESWLMVGLGCLFSFIAVIDGYKMDDPYPGYGRVSRQHKDSYDEYVDLYNDLIDRLRDILDASTKTMEETRSDLGKRRREHDHILAGRTRLINTYNDHQGYLEKCVNSLLTIYRTANRRARVDDTGPPHFDQPWSLQKNDSMEPAPASLMPTELDEAIAKTDAALEEAIHDLHDAFDEAIAKYKPIDALGSMG